jgi:hypothetical protein
VDLAAYLWRFDRQSLGESQQIDQILHAPA